MRAVPPKQPARRPAVPDQTRQAVRGRAKRPQPAATASVAVARPEVARAPAPDEPPVTQAAGLAAQPVVAPKIAPGIANQPVISEPAVQVARAPLATEAAPQPAAAAPEAEPAPGGRAPDLAPIFQASRTLVEGSLRVPGQMVGIGCRQAEHGLAVGRALLAGGSLPAVLALQASYLGRAVDDALAQTLELSRLSAEVVRAGLESLRQR